MNAYPTPTGAPYVDAYGTRHALAPFPVAAPSSGRGWAYADRGGIPCRSCGGGLYLEHAWRHTETGAVECPRLQHGAPLPLGHAGPLGAWQARGADACGTRTPYDATADLAALVSAAELAPVLELAQ